MSYQTKLDEMVGKHVAEYQAEFTMAANAPDLGRKPPATPMPYGYPVRLYHPHHRVMMPRATPCRKHGHGRLSNDVPWVVSMDLVEDYAVGLYNPRKTRH